jgi:hypothetical protein
VGAKKNTSVGPVGIQSSLIQRVSQTKPVDTNFSRYRSQTPISPSLLYNIYIYKLTGLFLANSPPLPQDPSADPYSEPRNDNLWLSLGCLAFHWSLPLLREHSRSQRHTSRDRRPCTTACPEAGRWGNMNWNSVQWGKNILYRAD